MVSPRVVCLRPDVLISFVHVEIAALLRRDIVMSVTSRDWALVLAPPAPSGGHAQQP